MGVGWVLGFCARVHERVDGWWRVAGERAGSPAVAAIAALPDLPVGERREQPAITGNERVGHCRERVGKPATERTPGLSHLAAVDARLRVAAAVCGIGAGARRDVPPLG